MKDQSAVEWVELGFPMPKSDKTKRSKRAKRVRGSNLTPMLSFHRHENERVWND